MVFHEIGPKGAPIVLLLGPELAGWWSMAPLSKRLTSKFRCVLAGHNGFGETYGTPFISVVEEGEELARYAQNHTPAERFRAIVGVGLGGQVAVEALCEDAECAECAVLGDVLCEPEPGAKSSARINAATWGFMKRPAYAKRQLENFGIPRAVTDVFVKDAAVTSRKTVRQMTLAMEEWRIPNDIRAITCPVRVTVAALQSEPRRKSAEALAMAIPHATLTIQKDISRNELYLRYPDRCAEWLVPWIERCGSDH